MLRQFLNTRKSFLRIPLLKHEVYAETIFVVAEEHSILRLFTSFAIAPIFWMEPFLCCYVCIMYVITSLLMLYKEIHCKYDPYRVKYDKYEAVQCKSIVYQEQRADPAYHIIPAVIFSEYSKVLKYKCRKHKAKPKRANNQIKQCF